MDKLIDNLEAQFAELALRISRLESVEDQPSKFADLDRELVSHISHVRKQYETCKKIESLQIEGQDLDTSINSTLIKLDECRKQLEKSPSSAASTSPTQKVDSQTLLDYATKITRFTRQMPGTVDPTVLPWPTEDWLRRGMLATLTIQDEQKQAEHPESAEHLEHDEHMDHSETVDSAQPEPSTDSGSHHTAGDATAEPSSAQQQRAKRPARAPKQKISLDFDSDDD